MAASDNSTAETRGNEASAAFRRRRRWVRRSDRVAAGVLFGAVVGFLIWEHPFWRPSVTVRSCGGNFDMLAAFAADFEARHRCRVRYVAAPVQFLLDLAVRDAGHLPEVLVGRSGPGWLLLQSKGKLAQGAPELFGVDPFVVVTPRGNPAGIRCLDDLGRDGVRVASSPDAMRPKGKVVAELMSGVSEARAPGLVDRWERNTVQEAPCGRLLARLVAKGRADAAVVARSQTVLDPLRGNCEVVEISVADLDCMRSGRGAIPQSVARTVRNPGNPLADRFVAELVQDSRGIAANYGYLTAASGQMREYAPFLRVFTPDPMAPRQMELAALLRRDGCERESVRRYLYAIHVFGPGRHEAEAWYRLGEACRDQGRDEGARLAWSRLLARHPTPGVKEWLDTSAFGASERGDPETEWVALGRAGMRALPGSVPAGAVPDWLQATIPAPLRVREGDPPKGARRSLAVAVDLLGFGIEEFAIRDALKVVALHYPSPHTPAARALAGAAQYRRGRYAAAAAQWQRVCAEYPDSAWAAACREARAAVAESPARIPDPDPASPMPNFEPAYDTQEARGMAYAWELHEAGLPLYAAKEYLKVSVGLYGRPTRLAEALYRGGVCLWHMDRHNGARQLWQRCAVMPAENPWTREAATALQRWNAPETDDRQTLRARLEIPAATTPDPGPRQGQSPGQGPGQGAGQGGVPAGLMRLRLGEELLLAGVLDDDEALQEFLKVLTVVKVPPSMGWLRGRAHMRAAQALLLCGREEPARAHLEAARVAEGREEDRALASRLLERLTGEGRTTP
ncbi:MAG: substrate-binding domain-containing protein [Lentisphaeria bacterium]|nr:substrate-binding domain-containing protein [Lentisphaeria bacterium]